MRFDEEVRRNFKPEEKTTNSPTTEEITNSAIQFVDEVKNELMNRSRNGQIITKKKGLLSKKGFEYTIPFWYNQYTKIPMACYQEDNYLGWNLSIDKNTMKAWWGTVDNLLKENGIEKLFVGKNLQNDGYARFYIWL